MATYDLAYPGAAIDAILNTAYFLQEAGYIFQGSASEYSGTPSKRVWVIAPAGFTGFGITSPVPKGSIGLCLYNGTAWVGKIINILTLDSVPTRNSQNGVTSGGVAATLDEITSGIMDTFASLLFDDETAAGDLSTKLSYAVKFSVSDVYQTVTHLNILAATTSKAGLMSAEDKAKVDSFLTGIRSMQFVDATTSAEQSIKLVEQLKWTVGGVQEVIDSITLLAATSSKAGLLSASDKAYIDALPATLTSLSNSISGALALMQSMMGYYVCDTAAGTAAKTVDATGYSLTNGGCIRIKMNNVNTAANVTLNINSTGAKALYYDGAQASSTNTWEAGEVLEVYYDGTQYQCASGGGGKFASGEKVKETSITDEVTENSTALLESGAVYSMKYNMEQAEETTMPMTISYEQGNTSNTDGSDIADDKNIRTDYLDVTDTSSVILYSTLPSGYTLVVKPTWYNGSKVLLSEPSWTPQSNQPITVSVPSGAVYLRLVIACYQNTYTRITLTPASATIYSFILSPFEIESDSRWYGLLKKCEVLNELDDVPKNGSQNLVRSEGIYSILFDSQKTEILGGTLNACGYVIRGSDNKWISASGFNAALVDVSQYRGEICRLIKETANGVTYAFLTAGATVNQVASYCSGYTAVVHSDADVMVSVPSDAVYMYVYLNSNSTYYTPSKLIFGVDDFNTRIEDCEDVAGDVEELDKAVFSTDDEEIILGTEIPSCGGTISNQNKWTANNDYFGGLINCSDYQGKECFIKKGDLNIGYAFLKSGFVAGQTPDYATGSYYISIASDVNTIVPSDAVYLYVYLQSTSANNYRPQYVKLGYEGLVKKVGEIEQELDNMSGGNSFRIACYNIGHFAHGANQNSSITGTDYVEKLAAYRQLVYGKLGTDVIGLCEYSAIFGNDETTNQSAEEVLFNRFEFDFIGEQIRYSCNALYSNLYVENMAKKIFECNQDAVITHTSLIEATDYYYIEADLWFHGSLIKLIMTHLAFDSNNPQIVANQISELITKFASETKVIMMGDWNVASFSQFDPFVAAGYTLGNKGQATYSDTNPTKALDNIIVKGLDISNVGVVQTSGLSDHLPIYATITLP